MVHTPRGSIAFPTIFAVLGAVAIGVVVITLVRDISLPQEGVLVNHGVNSTACTQEAKLCPDGSAVGRTGPNCEFAACPGTNGNANVSGVTAEWETYTNDALGFSFRYPGSYTRTDGADQYTVANISTAGKSMTVGYLDGPLDPANVQGIYGRQPTTTVRVGNQDGYEYVEGDAGCGGPFIQTPLANSRILRISFVSCDGSPNALTYESGEGATILSTFQFTTP